LCVSHGADDRVTLGDDGRWLGDDGRWPGRIWFRVVGGVRLPMNT